jgi:glucan phosphorylase
MDSARDVSTIALWENQIRYYQEAYSIALGKVIEAQGAFPGEYNEDQPVEYKKIGVNDPSWKSVMVTRHLPDAISGLETLSKNLWWCWNESAKSLFKSIDSDVWHDTKHNPMALLDIVSLKRFKALAKDEDFMGNYKSVMNEFNAYMALKAERTDPMIGYFCMEYGLDTSLKIYSGGLGILAGDYLKESSDMNVNMVAVGLLYRYGYFTQKITPQGNQVAEYNAQDFLKIPAEPVLGADGKILAAVTDATQPQITINAAGEIVETKFGGTKRELKEGYNMVAYSNATLEWYEQAKNFTDFAVGKTVDELQGVETKVNDEGHTVFADEALYASVSISIDGMTAVLVKAANNAA